MANLHPLAKFSTFAFRAKRPDATFCLTADLRSLVLLATFRPEDEQQDRSYVLYEQRSGLPTTLILRQIFVQHNKQFRLSTNRYRLDHNWV